LALALSGHAGFAAAGLALERVLSTELSSAEALAMYASIAKAILISPLDGTGITAHDVDASENPIRLAGSVRAVALQWET